MIIKLIFLHFCIFFFKFWSKVFTCLNTFHKYLKYTFPQEVKILFKIVFILLIRFFAIPSVKLTLNLFWAFKTMLFIALVQWYFVLLNVFLFYDYQVFITLFQEHGILDFLIIYLLIFLYLRSLCILYLYPSPSLFIILIRLPYYFFLFLALGLLFFRIIFFTSFIAFVRSFYCVSSFFFFGIPFKF